MQSVAYLPAMSTHRSATAALAALLGSGLLGSALVGLGIATAPAAVGSEPAATRPAAAQWRDVSPGVDRQFRGLAAVSSSVAWVAGVQGTVLRTVDGGRRWRNVSPPGLPADLQFRDIEASDAQTAVALTIGTGTDSRIYRTVDGGAHWSLSFTNTDPAAFYDCMAFFDPADGIALSDPTDGKFRIARTTDGGRSWRVQSSAGMPAALPGEAAFAASGTCVVTSGPHDAWIASGGGATARVFHSTDTGHTWTVAPTTVASGDAAGIFSLAPRWGFALVAVGGDFTDPTGRARIAATSGNSTRWTSSRVMPGGYRSGVSWIPGSTASLVAVGPTGSDVSNDAGRSWTTFDTGSFDNVQCASDGACWAAGSAGRIGVLVR